MDSLPKSDVLTSQQIYEEIKSTLAKTEGIDADISKIIATELLHDGVDEQTCVKEVLEKLLSLASDRANKEPNVATPV